jgi:acetolactate synthase-1/2/3 large subunit
MIKKINVDSTGEALLELLDARGVEYFFGGGGGTDSPPIFEAFAKRLAHGRSGLRPITVTHEITTVAMAHGYSMVSGRPAFAMVHTSVGTANAISGIINASRARVPVFLAAGRNPITEKGHHTSRLHGVHWAQECFDQAGMLREFVKWDYQLHFPEQLETAVDRGFAVAQDSPAGPVYMTLPLEILGQPLDSFEFSSVPRLKASASRYPDPLAIREAAQLLAGAENPIVITTALGRDPDAVQELVKLAERLALPVIDFWHTYMNFPQDHPLHIGYDSALYVKEADVIVVIEADVPWIPRITEPDAGASIIQIDEDPLYRNYPYRGFPTDIGLAGAPRLTLAALDQALNEIPLDDAAIEIRRRKWHGENARKKRIWSEHLEAIRNDTPIDPKWISKCVGDKLGKDDILVTEYVLDPSVACFTRPATYFNHSHAGGLGWGPGAALGAKLAAPDRTVVCCIGDGCHVFGVPVSTHHMAQANDLPVLFVIYNNAAWGKSRMAAFHFAPDGYAAKAGKVPLCELEPSPDYAAICAACGGYGRTVTDPAALPEALAQALDVVRNEKRQALLNVISKK